MSAYSGPEFNESGLVYYHDMNNRKSYAGAPTTNHVPNADTMPGWSTYGGTPVAFQTEFGTTGYRLTNAPSWNGIYRTVTLPSTGTYTFSTWIRYLGGSPNNNGGTVYISGWGGGDTSTAVNKSIIGQWQRVTRTLTVTTTSMTFYIISFGGTNDGNSDRSSWEITMPQVEAGSVATTFVNGTRSSTQVLRDLVGNRTITPSSLTYNSNNTFEFDGIDDRLLVDTASPTTWNDSFSIETLINIPTGADWHDTVGGSNSGTAIVARGSYSGSHGLLRSDSQQFRFWTRTDAGSYSSTFTGAQYDTWYHLVGVYNGTLATNTLYVNGQSAGTSAVTKSGVPGSGSWQIGGGVAFGGTSGRYGKGNIPVVKIYNRAVPAAEIYSNYTAVRLRYGI